MEYKIKLLAINASKYDSNHNLVLFIYYVGHGETNISNAKASIVTLDEKSYPIEQLGERVICENNTFLICFFDACRNLGNTQIRGELPVVPNGTYFYIYGTLPG